jgi:hypothetical protein
LAGRRGDARLLRGHAGRGHWVQLGGSCSPPAQSYLGLQIAGLLRGGQLGDGTGRQTQGLCAALWGRVCDCVLAPGRDAGRQAFSPFAHLVKGSYYFGQCGHSAQNRECAGAPGPQFFSRVWSQLSRVSESDSERGQRGLCHVCHRADRAAHAAPVPPRARRVTRKLKKTEDPTRFGSLYL